MIHSLYIRRAAPPRRYPVRFTSMPMKDSRALTAPLPPALKVYEDGEKIVYHPLGTPPTHPHDSIVDWSLVPDSTRDAVIAKVRAHAKEHGLAFLNRIHWLTTDASQITHTPGRV